MSEKPCPICGENQLKGKLVEEIFKYKGATLKIDDYKVLECASCGEEVVPRSEMKRTTKTIKDFHRKVDGLLTSGEIKQTRKKLALTQEEMGEILGGGLKAFARYENGQVTQSKVMDNLLRILAKYPFALDVINPKYHNVTSVSSVLAAREAYTYNFEEAADNDIAYVSSDTIG